MGLLDDAIREHLELKRQRGADAGDISREESEALGPVRRGPDGAPDLSGTALPGEAPAEVEPDAPSWDGEQTAVLGTTPVPHDDATASSSAYAPPPPAPIHEPPAPPATTGYEPPPVPAYEPPGASSPPPAEPERPWFERAHDVPEQEGEDFGLDPRPALEPEPEPEHTSLLARFRVGRKHKGEREPAPSGDEPSSAFEPPPAHHHPDIVAADDEPDVEDVLEETPDFLEETPEHDRLWFEQRPPRDFDFDDK